MAEAGNTERVHKTNIERLIEEFGQEHQVGITSLYDSMRLSTESNVKIKDFTPIFLYRTVRESFSLRGSE